MISDLLEENLNLVFCGTALSHVSFQKRAYYAGPQNRFWPTLSEIGLTPHLFSPEDYFQLLNLGIGLMDVVKNQHGMDKEIRFHAELSLGVLERIKKYSPKVLAFTSKTAFEKGMGEKASSYGMQGLKLGETEIRVLPSPSAAARRYWSIEPWNKLALRIRQG